MDHDNSAAHNQLQKPIKCRKKSFRLKPEIQFAKLCVGVLVMVLFLAHTVFAQSTMWQGDVSSDWHIAGNWSNGVPTIGLLVTIPDVSPPSVDPVINSAANAKRVLLYSGAFLTISAGGTLNINGNTGHGLYNSGSVENNGTVQINNVGSIGILVTTGGYFINKGTITIGNSEYVNSSGIDNEGGTFINESGSIAINRTGTEITSVGAIYNTSSFVNKASISIGGLLLGDNGGYGIWNTGASANFQNQTGGVISIDRIAFDGILNAGSGVMTNQGSIQIGSAGDLGGDGIENSATLNNSTCTALIHVASNNIIKNSGTLFTNAGTIIETSDGNSSISSNTGLVQNLNGGTFTITSGTAAITTAGSIWKGCTSTGWSVASNWHRGVLPNVTDDVIIPDVTNNPIISTLNGVAKSVSVETGGVLTITAAGALTINGSATQGILNKGTVTNDGLFLIGLNASTGDYGIRNEGTFTHNAGLLQVEKAAQAALYNVSGTFTNKGSLFLKTLDTAPFLVNSTGGTISNSTGGRLNGTGNIKPTHFDNSGGVISPGYSPGLMTFTGNEIFTNSTMAIEVNGKAVAGANYDQIIVNGTATLGGTLAIAVNFPSAITGDVVTILDATALSGTFSTVTGLPGNWTLAYNTPNAGEISIVNAGPLPVILAHFTAKKLNKSVQLDWQTTFESNNQGFHIERRRETGNWENIGFVDGNGSTIESNTYSFLDQSPLPVMNYYRLHQLDFNGDFEYSRIVGVRMDLENVVKIYPNPTTGILNIEGAQSGVKIFDLSGRPVMNVTIINQKIDISNLPAGHYMMSVFSENKEKSISIVKH